MATTSLPSRTTVNSQGIAMSAATPPFLQSLSARAWQAFLEDWEAYRARGGRSPVRHCVSSTVLKVIELRLPKAHARVAAEREAKEESQKVERCSVDEKYSLHKACSCTRQS